MNTDKLNLILHPVRLRILTTISGREMTAQQLSKALPDIAVATLYRHINALQEGDLLTVVDERQVRGTVEKTYAIQDESALILSEEDLKNATKEEHIRYFTTYLVSLIADFTTYLQNRETVDFAKDGVGYHTSHLYMTDDELKIFSEQLSELLMPFTQPADGRKRRQLSTIFLPSSEDED